MSERLKDGSSGPYSIVAAIPSASSGSGGAHQVGHPAQGTDKPEVAETGGEQGQQPRIVADVEKPHVARVNGEVGRDVWKDVLGVIEEVVPQLVGVGVVITVLWDP